MSRFQRPLRELANPTLVLGRWQPAILKARKIAFIRKQTLSLILSSFSSSSSSSSFRVCRAGLGVAHTCNAAVMGQEWVDPRTHFEKPSPKDAFVKNIYGQYKPNKGHKFVLKQEARSDLTPHTLSLILRSADPLTLLSLASPTGKRRSNRR